MVNAMNAALRRGAQFDRFAAAGFGLLEIARQQMRPSRNAVMPRDVCGRDKTFGHVAKFPRIAGRSRCDEARMNNRLPALEVRRVLMLPQHFLTGGAVSGLVARVRLEH